MCRTCIGDYGTMKAENKIGIGIGIVHFLVTTSLPFILSGGSHYPLGATIALYMDYPVWVLFRMLVPEKVSRGDLAQGILLFSIFFVSSVVYGYLVSLCLRLRKDCA